MKIFFALCNDSIRIHFCSCKVVDLTNFATKWASKFEMAALIIHDKCLNFITLTSHNLISIALDLTKEC